jgi:hypothetical protein
MPPAVVMMAAFVRGDHAIERAALVAAERGGAGHSIRSGMLAP